jgi:hypothetical protein
MQLCLIRHHARTYYTLLASSTVCAPEASDRYIGTYISNPFRQASYLLHAPACLPAFDKAYPSISIPRTHTCTHPCFSLPPFALCSLINGCLVLFFNSQPLLLSHLLALLLHSSASYVRAYGAGATRVYASG